MAAGDGSLIKGIVSYEDFASRSAQLEGLGALVQAGVLTEAQMSDALAHTFAPRQLAALRAINGLIQYLNGAALILTSLTDPGGQIDEELLYGLAVVDLAAQDAVAGWVTRHGLLAPGSGIV